MRNKESFLSLLLLILLMPYTINAKEYCQVVSGNGKEIGSENACGTEHFYIVDSNEEEIKMLAKYNLYTGYTIDKEKINRDAADTRSDYDYCYDLATSTGGQLLWNGFYNEDGYCFIKRQIVEEKILQKETAKSAHWDQNNNYLYPQVGDVYMQFNNPGIIAHSTPIVEDSIVTGISIEYQYNDNRYSLIYGQDTYDVNKETLKATFGEDNCNLNDYGISCYGNHYNDSGSALIDGHIGFIINNYGCTVNDRGTNCALN